MSDNLEWDRSLAEYRRLRLASALMPLGTEGEDEAIDAYCVAFDKLIVTPAPSLQALAEKLDLAIIRCGNEGIFAEYAEAIAADLRRLAELPDRRAFDPTEWIGRATDAGAAMFVRGEELWIGSVVASGRPEDIQHLKAELDDERRAAVRDVLASRGLVCAEA